jgi:glucosamine--fructose-6-phosphate aminotransferase (isomerizing)
VGRKQAGPIILEGLRKLEYRGYDSAGLAVGSSRAFHIRQAVGTLRNLQAAVRLDPVRGTYGIGRTGWTSGRANLADPDRSSRAAHRGIIVAVAGKPSNLGALRAKLPYALRHGAGTDAEILAILVGSHRKRGVPLEEAVRLAIAQIRGSCALAVISKQEPGKIVAARLGLAAMIGLGKNENFITSDIPAILSRTRDMIQLEDRDIAVLTSRGVLVTDSEARPVSRPVHHVLWDPLMAEKSGYKHFMLKEIFEQPRSIRETVLGHLDEETGKVFLDELGVTPRELREISHLIVIGSGSSWHAGLTAKAMIEQLAHVHVEVEYGSEFRYSDPVIDERVLSLVISQSGETADTLASQELAHEKGSKTIAICNSVASRIAHTARGAIYTNAGPELAAASTKSFTSQLAALYLFAMHLGQVRGQLTPEESMRCARGLLGLPGLAEAALELAGRCERIARQLAHAGRVLFLGRGVHFPIALEGARKLQELSHIPAIGCAAGEMRHGPTAIIDDDLIVVVIATVDRSHPSSLLRYERTVAQVRELAARQARVICIANKGDRRIHRYAHEVISVPSTHELLQPVIELIPLQLLAYHVAVLRGLDIDQPLDVGLGVASS